jgi:ribosomal protein L31E
MLLIGTMSEKFAARVKEFKVRHPQASEVKLDASGLNALDHVFAEMFDEKGFEFSEEILSNLIWVRHTLNEAYWSRSSRSNRKRTRSK